MLKTEIESHARLAGYYIIKFVDISELRHSSPTDEELLDTLFQNFDDQRWPAPEDRPRDQSWSDYVTDRATAMQHAIETLEGGSRIGHLRATIDRSLAQYYFERFEALFDAPMTYSQYAFNNGIAIVAEARAGILWVVEND